MDANTLTLSNEEANNLLHALHYPPTQARTSLKRQRNYLAGLLMLDSGLRCGEVVKLKVGDLVFKGMAVKSIIIRPEIAKNKKERVVPCSFRLMQAIEPMLAHWSFLTEEHGTEFAFRRSGGDDHISVRQLERIIQKAALVAIGRRVHPHQLRHTFATRLMKVTNTRTVQQLLGHSCLSSTQIYTHPSQEDRIDAIREVENRNPKKN